MMSNAYDIASSLPARLQSARHPGEFCASGSLPVPVASLAVRGVGVLAMPVLPAQFDQLAAIAQPTPHGRGPDTVYDATVRRSLQIGADQVDVSRPNWQTAVTHVTKAAAGALGAEGAVAELYKLLIYQPGDFFLPHRDTEKLPGMFATLVIALPSAYEGAQLLVRHAGQERVVLESSGDQESLQWAAFYADCQHEVRPLLQGHRAVLVYSLVRPGQPLPEPPQIGPTIEELRAVLGDWADRTDGPIKLVMPLEHRYSLAELSFDNLKGQDAAVASVLLAAADPDEFAVRLASYAHTENGSAEEVYYGRRRRWEEPEEVDDYQVVDINESTKFIADLVSPVGADGDWGSVEVADGELAPPDCLEDEPWDEDEYSEATGNEGATFERAYRRTALVIWPLVRELEVVAQGGTLAMANAIARYAKLPRQGNGRAARLALKLLSEFPRPGADGSWYRPRYCSETLRAFSLLDGAGDPSSPLAVFLLEVTAARGFQPDDVDAAVLGVQRVHPEVAVAAVAGVAASVPPSHAAAALQVFAALADRGDAEGTQAAVALLMQRIGEHALSATSYALKYADRADGLAFWRQLMALAARHPGCVDWRQTERLFALVEPLWPIDICLIPLLREGPPPPSPLARSVTAFARAFVAARAHSALAPPANWLRSAAGLTCNCEACGRFRAFLGHPGQERWPLAALKAVREHVERMGAEAQLDVAFATLRKGSPHTLVVSKTNASYERKVTQRKVDLQDLQWLESR